MKLLVSWKNSPDWICEKKKTKSIVVRLVTLSAHGWAWVSFEFDELIKSLTNMGMLHGLKKNRLFVSLNESDGNNSRYDET